MRQHEKRPWIVRVVVWTLVLGQVTGAVPIQASTEPERPRSAPEPGSPPVPTPVPAPPPRVRVNRTVPKVSPPPSAPTFSVQPTEAEIFRARVFEEPLVPMGQTTDSENQDLAKAITAYLGQGQSEWTGPMQSFLATHPKSAWRPALLANLGGVYHRSGYYSRALRAWEEAWSLSKKETDPLRKAVADRALGGYLTLLTRLGRVETLEPVLAEIKDRPLGGSAAEKVSWARDGLWQMRNNPGESFRCGPFGLERIHADLKPQTAIDQRLRTYRSTARGTSLLQMRDLAMTVGLPLTQMAQRKPGAALLTPALVHWKAGHFAAVVKGQGGRYLVQDPTFGSDTWLSQAALDDESSGFYLVRDGALPEGWARVAEAEGAEIWGRGAAPSRHPEDHTRRNKKTGCGDEGDARMAAYNIHLMLVNLTISDSPVGYRPSRGPAPDFSVTYNQREVFQPQVFFYSNLGPKWTFDWLSYVEDEPLYALQNVKLYERGGGQLTFKDYNIPTQSYAPEFSTRAILTRPSSSPIRYERLWPDGSKEVFAQPDGATFPRKVFLTEWIDAQGNSLTFTYDSMRRLVAATDALGQVTTLSYELPGDPLKITKVTDPFGRFASFDYNAAGQLSRITDMIGIASEFTYTNGDFVSSLTTPYGTTWFEMEEEGYFRSLQVTDPSGGQERVESGFDDSPFPPPEPVPDGFTAEYLYYRNTFYWDRRAMALYPGDRTKAHIFHWTHSSDAGFRSDVLESEKPPLENRIWYAYPGQTSTLYEGTMKLPTKVARVVDDGTTQVHQYEYGPRGNVCKKTDPLGRETRYTYGTNNMPDEDCATGLGTDLLKVEQKNGSTYDELQSFTYNSLHQPLTITDAAGQTTTSTFLPDGRLQTVVTPPRNGPDGQPLTVAERTTTYTYYPSNAPTGPDMLQSVTGPSTLQGSAVTTYTYDDYGRLRTTTDPDSYTVTFDYDSLDRLVKTTYPDSTYEETVYDRFDPVKRRDRLGRWSETFYDAERRVVATRDPLGRTTTQQWCGCRSLEKIVDANGNATSWEYDAQGRKTKQIWPDGRFKTFTYENATSRLKSVTDPKNQTIQYGYDLDGKLVTTTYLNAEIPTPNVALSYRVGGQPTTGTPEPHGRLTQMTDGIGTTTYAYHPFNGAPGAGQLASVDGPLENDTVSYTYDEIGRVASRGLSGFMSSFKFDGLGRLATQVSPVGDFNYGYDGVTRRPLTLSYPNGQTTQYTYLPNSGGHRLQQIKHLAPGGGTTISQYDYTYDVVSNIKTWRQQAGANPAKLYTLGYDLADQLTTAVVTGPTPLPVPSRYAYAYDPAGNRTAEQLDDAVTGATYNNRNQLMSRQPGGALLFRGTLNEAASVTIQGKPAPVAADNTFAAQAQAPSGTSQVVVIAKDPSSNTRTNTYQVAQPGSTTTYTYDFNGNLTGDGTKTYEWNAEDRLTAAKQGPTMLASFTYDGQGRRATKAAGAVTTSYVYDGHQLLEERPSSGGTLRYVFGQGIDDVVAKQDGTGTYYFLKDHLGSVRQITSTSGAVVVTHDYDSWGIPFGGSGEPAFGFTGREWDSEPGLHYYRARYYDPKLGRFLSEDPIGFKGGPNLYSYVKNRPVNRIDPFGLADCDLEMQVCLANAFAFLFAGFIACGLGCDLIPHPLGRVACIALCIGGVTKFFIPLMDGCLDEWDKCRKPEQPPPKSACTSNPGPSM